MHKHRDFDSIGKMRIENNLQDAARGGRDGVPVPSCARLQAVQAFLPGDQRHLGACCFRVETKEIHNAPDIIVGVNKPLGNSDIKRLPSAVAPVASKVAHYPTGC